jgi:hypothetical protein
MKFYRNTHDEKGQYRSDHFPLIMPSGGHGIIIHCFSTKDGETFEQLYNAYKEIMKEDDNELSEKTLLIDFCHDIVYALKSDMIVYK